MIPDHHVKPPSIVNDMSPRKQNSTNRKNLMSWSIRRFVIESAGFKAHFEECSKVATFITPLVDLGCHYISYVQYQQLRVQHQSRLPVCPSACTLMAESFEIRT